MGGLSPRTVHHCHCILKQALRQAFAGKCLPAILPTRSSRPRSDASRSDLRHPTDCGTAGGRRGKRMFVPTVLAVLCGLRRGEIAALRWRHVDLKAGRLPWSQSAEQTKGRRSLQGAQERSSPHSGDVYTVVAELRAHRARASRGASEPWHSPIRGYFVVAQADGSPLRPHSLGHEWVRLSSRSTFLEFASMICATPMQRTCCRAACIPRSPASALGIARSALPWTLYSHVCPACRRTPLRVLTTPSGSPYRTGPKVMVANR